MSDESDPNENIDRLLKHVKEGSLAARLVLAHRASNAGSPAESIKAVMRDRLERVREDLDGGKS